MIDLHFPLWIPAEETQHNPLQRHNVGRSFIGQFIVSPGQRRRMQTNYPLSDFKSIWAAFRNANTICAITSDSTKDSYWFHILKQSDLNDSFVDELGQFFCLDLCGDLRRVSLSGSTHHKVSGSYTSRTVWRITKFIWKSTIRAGLIYSHTVCDVTSYFRSAVMEVRKNGRKCRLRRIWVAL